MQCGIACMAMVCKYYGRKCSFETLSNICTITNEGVSMQALKQLAEVLGFDVLCGKASLYQTKDINYPCLLHWNQNHFVVLYKVKKNRFYIADPAKGLVKYNLEEFKKHWISTQSGGEEKGIAMFSLRINISLVSDFFIKLLKLPMSFFDTKLMGDLMQRMGDHSRHSRTAHTGHDACRAVHHRAVQFTCRAVDEFLLFSAGREDKP